MAFKSNVMFMSTSFIEFVSNQQPSSIQEGGAITLFQSNAFFMELVNLNATMLKMEEQYSLLTARSM